MASKTRRRSGARVLDSKRIFRGRTIGVRVDRVVMPNGACSSREVVEYPGSVAIVPIPEPGKVILIRQYRCSARQYLWEIPAGTLERGEAPLAGARRELREEIGYSPRRLTLMADLFTSPGVLNERMRLYLATGLRPSQLEQDEDECIEPRLFTVRQALAMVRSRRIRDGKTLLGLSLLAQLYPKLAGAK